jgi:hypothetical protein
MKVVKTRRSPKIGQRSHGKAVKPSTVLVKNYSLSMRMVALPNSLFVPMGRSIER